MLERCKQTGLLRDLDQEERDYSAKWLKVALASEAQQRGNIDRICSRYELESDDFQTREQKALAYK